ncbi:MAG: threonine--tRNA ligase [Omnitrophica bacterium RIFCSPHIGHO2_02_FULL_51_18]|nr:MAG: threonine--tRNA ligase [Omnitrophica bacterium RIFCSPHIGHO2_02_FULL_51_18]
MSKLAEQYTDLDKLRHSCSHVLAQAVKRKYPHAKLGFGPPVGDGFYYDIELPEPLSDEDLAGIEVEMEKIIKVNYPFEKKAVTPEEARRIFKEKNETFKLETINQLEKTQELSIVTDGDFTDLCKYPHAASTGLIKAFKLTSIAGAYWKGDPNNKMMQRIYGVAFFTEKELKEYLRVREEAKKRDHRKLGKELDFFSIQEDGGPGLIFYHPKGALLRHLIEDFVKKEHLRRGYQFVIGPQILKSDIWVRSGHYAYYKQNMFIFKTEDEKEYAVKPMNCPGHMLIYKTKMRSYRDLPLRFFEMGNVCRNEKSGVLHGLLRVRNFTQDDAHIFCLPDSLEQEIASVVDFAFFVLDTFGFKEREIEISTRPEKSIGTDTDWTRATHALEGALKAKKINYKTCEGEGAFYGPKIDIKIKDALGRSWQCSTIQCDFALPQAFDLEYTGTDGQKHRPVMIHRAILGSVERFMGTLLEHYSGALPFWLSPVQLSVIPVSQAHEAYARKVLNELVGSDFRAELMAPDETLGSRIRQAQNEKIPYMIVVGDKEIQAEKIAVRSRSKGDLGQTGLAEFIKKLDEEEETKGY